MDELLNWGWLGPTPNPKIEWFLYWPFKSPHGNRFILKGALMFSVWSGPTSHPTMDIDLLGRIDNSLGKQITSIFTGSTP